MNILEAYIKKNKRIIIFITGINNLLLKKLGNELKNDLNLPLINLNEIIEKEFYENIDEEDLIKIKKELKKHKNYILIGFILPKIKYNFHYNIKFDNKYLIDKNLENSNEILKKYKEYLKNNKINRFLKYEKEEKEEKDNNEKILDELFNNLMELISKNVYEKDTIFKLNNLENNVNSNNSKKENNKVKDYRQKEIKELEKDYKYKKKWDPDNLYLDIDEYNERMLNIPTHDEDDDSIDEDIFLEMDFPSLSSQKNNYFVKDFYYKNFKGGNIKDKNYMWGFRYMKNL